MGKLTLAAATFALMFLASEATLRSFYPLPPTWLEPQITHLHSPLLGWVLPPGSRSFVLDAPVSVNSLGLRDDEIPREKPAGETRILCLGDSFSFALGIRFEDLYVQQLERRLARDGAPRHFEVINAAVSGYNTRQELIYLLTDGLTLEPDLITVGFYWNDLLNNEEPLPDLASTPRLADDGGHLQTGDKNTTHTIPAGIRNRLRQSLVFYLGTRTAKSLLAPLKPSTNSYAEVQAALLRGDEAAHESNWRATGDRLDEIAEVARKLGVPAILLVFPMEVHLRGSYEEMVFAKRLAEIWAPTGFPFVDLEPAYRAALDRGDNPFLPYDLHPSVLGMEIAADALYQEIRERGYLGFEKRGAP
jgi:lysophospholipase L1-like esterase